MWVGGGGRIKTLLQPANFTLGPDATLNTQIHKNSVQVIQSNIPILNEDPKVNSILPNFKIIKSKRLKRLLTKVKLNNNNHLDVKRCQRPNYSLCIHLIDAIEFKCRRKFYAHKSMNCEVKNVIYVMKCRDCGE